VNVTYDFAKADVVLSLDADFLGSGPGQVRYSKDFATRRRIRNTITAGQESEYVGVKGGDKVKAMNRLYVVECMPTITGSVADHSLPLAPSQVEVFARELGAKLGVPGVSASGSLSDKARSGSSRSPTISRRTRASASSWWVKASRRKYM